MVLFRAGRITCALIARCGYKIEQTSSKKKCVLMRVRTIKVDCLATITPLNNINYAVISLLGLRR